MSAAIPNAADRITGYLVRSAAPVTCSALAVGQVAVVGSAVPSDPVDMGSATAPVPKAYCALSRLVKAVCWYILAVFPPQKKA